MKVEDGRVGAVGETAAVIPFNELRYAVVEAEGARRRASAAEEIELPLELWLVVTAGAGADTGQVRVVKVVSAGYVEVPAEFTA